MSYGKNPIAVIGVSGRFPGAENVSELWNILREGGESIFFHTEEDLREAGISEEALSDPDYIRAAGVIRDADKFDANFFGISPKEAEYIDPQQRAFLECSHSALEDAGCDPTSYPGRISVFGGCALSYYQMMVAFGNYHDLSTSDVARNLFGVGTACDYLATRVSFKLRLKGAAITIQTACSTSLVALHHACQSLISGESDIALAGGVSVQSSYGKSGYYYSEGGLMSSDGYCRPYDSRASGTVFGDGVAIIVLKRLDEALANGDYIYGVIRGTAVNNDGADKAAFSAPSVSGQAAVIKSAVETAGVSSASIDYVEGHGTATSIGDPIEIRALAEAFSESRTQRCVLGSIKGNIGHLNHASGMSGLIKILLALEHGEIPGTKHFSEPSPNLALENTPFIITNKNVAWPRNERRRLASINNFGIGGTNAHAIIEEPPLRESSLSQRPWHIVSISGKSTDALNANTAVLNDYFEQSISEEFADAAYTLAEGRGQFAHRCAVIAESPKVAAQALRDRHPRFYFTGSGKSAPKIVFLISGQGSQRIGMGKGLYYSEPAFKEAFDRCCNAFDPHLGADLRALILGVSDDTPPDITETRYAQPAIFATAFATVALWAANGVKPDAFLGHSIGEVVAAALSGVMSLNEAARIVSRRGALMNAQPRGLMSSVPVQAASLAGRLPPGVEIAAVNSLASCVIAGPHHALAAFELELQEEGIYPNRLKTSHAFHTGMMDEAVIAFGEEVTDTKLNPPLVPFISNVSGTWITPEEACDPSYWARQIRSPVLFSQGVQSLLDADYTMFVEVGPGRALTTLTRQDIPPGRSISLITSLPRPGDDVAEVEDIARARAQAWVNGSSIKLGSVYKDEKRFKTRLPPYQFQRSRYWAISPRSADSGADTRLKHGAGTPQLQLLVPRWKVATWRPAVLDDAKWLIVGPDVHLTREVCDALRGQGFDVRLMLAAEQGSVNQADENTFYPGDPEMSELLITRLSKDGFVPEQVVYLGGVQDSEIDRYDGPFFGLTAVLRAIALQGWNTHVTVVTAGAYRVIGDEPLYPWSVTSVGPALTAQIEQVGLTSRVIDVDKRDLIFPDTARSIVEGIGVDYGAPVLALRSGRYWRPDFTELHIPAGLPGDGNLLSPEDVVLITGGLGDLGLIVAKALAKMKAGTLILLSRRALPPRSEWQALLADESGHDQLRRRIRAVLDIEQEGCTVIVSSANITSRTALNELVSETERKHGCIKHVFHLAGVPGSRPLILKNNADMLAVLAPKIEGLEALMDVFEGRPLGCLVLFSSIASLTAGIGQTDYAAANAFLDTFAMRGHPSARKIISINWDAWKGGGMAVNFEQPDNLADAWLALVERIGLSPDEGLAALALILKENEPQVLVSKRVVQDGRGVQAGLIRLADNPRPPEENSEMTATDDRPKYMRPPLSVDHVAPTSDIECFLAEMWEEMLQISGIGIADDFIELGGHSLLALQMVPRIRKHFDIQISPQDIFEEISSLTISELAAVITLKIDASASMQVA